MKILLTLLAALLLAAPALADTTGARNIVTSDGSAPGWILCSGQTTTGVACIGGGDKDVILLGGQLPNWQFLSVTSTATTYSCQAHSASAFSTTAKAALSGVVLTDSVEMIHFTGILAVLWFECTTITGGTVTITAHAMSEK